MSAGKTIKILGNFRKIRLLKAPRFKEQLTIAMPVRWDSSVYKDYIQAIPTNTARINVEFGRIAKDTAGLPLHERLRIIGEKMRGAGARMGIVRKVRPKREVYLEIARVKGLRA